MSDERSNGLKITDFSNYRDYLREHFVREKNRNKRFSFSYCAKRLKTSAPYLKHVMSGKRHISIDKIPKLKQLFGLSSFEARYLLFLFLYETSRDPEMRSYFYDILSALRGQESALSVLTKTKPQEGNPRRLADWLPMAIHELPRLPGFKYDTEWIQNHLIDKPPASDIEAALQLLIEDGDLIRTERGLERVEREHTPSPEAFESFQVYKIALRKTMEVIDALPRNRDAQFYSGSLAVDEKGLKQMFKALDRVTNELSEISDGCSTPTRVVMFSFNLFNLS